MFDLFTKIGLPHPAVEQILHRGRTIDVLRLDKIDPYISGNKLFKLKYNVQEALKNNQKIATFGGAYSNHILATAYLGFQLKIPTFGVIRGEELANKELNSTLQKAQNWGMKFSFVYRADYRTFKENPNLMNLSDCYWIPEGGNNVLGSKGCQEILDFTSEIYDEIYLAIGTSGTVNGIANSLKENQKLYGIPVLKGLDLPVFPQTEILTDYHWGGYAKFDKDLISFIEKMWKEYKLPLDPIYTAKSLYACLERSDKTKKILWIHTGGIQANTGINEKYGFNLPTIEQAYTSKV